jgi:hypothetical protein
VREDVHQITAAASNRARRATENQGRAGLEVVDGFCHGRGGLLAMTIGVIGMEFFQFAGEMGSACVPLAASGVTPDAFGKCSQRDVANGDRDGRAPHSYCMK